MPPDSSNFNKGLSCAVLWCALSGMTSSLLSPSSFTCPAEDVLDKVHTALLFQLLSLGRLSKHGAGTAAFRLLIRPRALQLHRRRRGGPHMRSCLGEIWDWRRGTGC